MTAQNSVNLTTPVGRIVQGSLYDPQTKDMDGKPLVVKTGPNAGQPTQRFYFALAIPKGAERHWAETEWGAKIWAVGHTAFPAQAQRPDFAWKIEDGDSTIPNKKNRKPCDQEGFPRHWVLRLSSGFPPKIFNANGTVALTEKDAVKPGYYVQVNLNVTGNNDANRNPGVYLNHSMVALAGYGPEIQFGPDPASAGFGTAALPPGASATPVGGLAIAGPGVTRTMTANAKGATYEAMIAAGWTDALLLQHGMMLETPTAAPPSATATPPPPVLVAAPPASAVPTVPHAAILTPPPPPTGTVAAPARQMTAKAGGVTYESMIAAGWTDAILVQHGYMTP